MPMGSIYFPDFEYYKLDRDVMAMQDGALVPAKEIPYWRRARTDVLRAAMTLLRHDADAGEDKQRWVNAMMWSWFNWMPEYFFTAPASATHKYHPSWAGRPDGLMLHSLAVCRVAASLSELLSPTPREYNILIFAAWHHDMFKYGGLDRYEEGKMTVHEHPLLAGDFFLLRAVQDVLSGFGIGPEDCRNVSDLISTHAGPYRTSKYSDLKLPECAGAMNRLLYKSDYVASRKETDWVKDVLVMLP